MRKTFLILFFNLTIICFSCTNAAFSYTEREYRIYIELMETPMSISEDEAHKQLGRKYGMSPTEIETIVERLMKEIYSGGSEKFRELERQINTVVGKIAKMKTIIVSGEFANVAYIEEVAAWDKSDVKRKTLSRMPKILEAIFSVSGIDRVRLTAYYPTTNGDVMKVAGFEAYRYEFNPNKSPEEYANFWVR